MRLHSSLSSWELGLLFRFFIVLEKDYGSSLPVMLVYLASLLLIDLTLAFHADPGLEIDLDRKSLGMSISSSACDWIARRDETHISSSTRDSSLEGELHDDTTWMNPWLNPQNDHQCQDPLVWSQTSFAWVSREVTVILYYAEWSQNEVSGRSQSTFYFSIPVLTSLTSTLHTKPTDYWVMR